MRHPKAFLGTLICLLVVVFTVLFQLFCCEVRYRNPVRPGEIYRVDKQWFRIPKLPTLPTDQPVPCLHQAIQSNQYCLLKRMCGVLKKHDASFWALHETLLGAVRHKGLLPWKTRIALGMEDRDLFDTTLFRADVASQRLHMFRHRRRSSYLFILGDNDIEGIPSLEMHVGEELPQLEWGKLGETRIPIPTDAKERLQEEYGPTILKILVLPPILPFGTLFEEAWMQWSEIDVHAEQDIFKNISSAK